MPKRRRIAFESAEVTVAVKLADIPEYLKNGELFKSMQTNSSAAEEESMHDADQIEVPAKFIKADQSVSCVDDAWSLLHSLRYWIVGTDLPSSLVVFCLSPSGKSIPTSLWNAFSAQFSHLNVLRRMVTSRAKDPSAKVRMAIATGDFNLLRLVHETLQCLPGSACVDAARTGNLACLQYVHERLPRNLRRRIVKACIQAGSLECLTYAVSQGYDLPADACTLAAAHGQLSCLQYLCSLQVGIIYSHICIAAARAGHLECLRFATEQGAWSGVEAMDAAAKSGQISCLEYLRGRGVAWDEMTCAAAASVDQLACLRYLHEHGCPWDEYACMDAAEMGSLRCLQYAHENGCPWNKRACQVAAVKGHLHCLQYAHKHGCPWDEFTCMDAAGGGSLSCLQYAHENGCPWSTRTCTTAASTGLLPCLQYAHEHGCPWDELRGLRL